MFLNEFDAHKHEVIMFVQAPKHPTIHADGEIAFKSDPPKHHIPEIIIKDCAGFVSCPLFICTLPSGLVCNLPFCSIGAASTTWWRGRIVFGAVCAPGLHAASRKQIKTAWDSDMKSTQTGQEKTAPKSVNNIRPFTNVNLVEGLGTQLSIDI